MEKYVIGIDYGTQSARAAVVRASDGSIMGTCAYPYPHGVMSESLPDGTKLPEQFALAEAEDYIEALEKTVIGAVAASKVARDDIVGLCVDATSCTVVPVDGNMLPLSLRPEYKNRPEAYIKMWKHHAAKPQTERANALAKAMDMPFMQTCGGEMSSEWMIPKLLEMRENDREVYESMNCALDLCDYLTMLLTGDITRGLGSAAFKSNWVQGIGYPSEEYLEGLAKGFAGEYLHLMRGEIIRPGEKAGVLQSSMAEKLGLPAGITVAGGILDGHTSIPTSGLYRAGDVSLVIGTSNVSAILTEKPMPVPAGAASAMDGFAPGLFAIDSGQSCTGDMLGWYMKYMLPAYIEREAGERGMSVYDHLNDLAEKAGPWKCPVTVMDWWNGNRNVMCNLNLKGNIQGISLSTRPEDIYTAMIQAIACGTRKIFEDCEKKGAKIENIVACGGIPQKNPFLMQQYANILGRTLRVACADEGPAMGSAIFAACAAGIYESYEEAAKHMQVRRFIDYAPDTKHKGDYSSIYARFCKYYELLGETDKFYFC
ncbi:MAG: ribulokinase [Clostridiales bacterium]|nr:ribulokinase [Clostridiales bacterium]